MLLWKSWRDLRIAFFVGLGWLAFLAAGDLWHLLSASARVPAEVATPDQAAGLVVGFLAIQTLVLALLAFAMGIFGVGRDIGNGSGSFLLTRPLPRRSFVWTEWCSGLLALAILLLLAVLGLWLTVRCHAFRVIFSTTSGGSTTEHAWTLASIPIAVTAVDALCAFLFLALVFSITHLGTVAFRHSTAGLLFSLSYFGSWLIVMAILRHEYPWLAPQIPDLLLRPLGSDLQKPHFIPHLTSSILARLALLPLFPLIAQFFLSRAEV